MRTLVVFLGLSILNYKTPWHALYSFTWSEHSALLPEKQRDNAQSSYFDTDIHITIIFIGTQIDACEERECIQSRNDVGNLEKGKLLNLKEAQSKPLNLLLPDKLCDEPVGNSKVNSITSKTPIFITKRRQRRDLVPHTTSSPVMMTENAGRARRA